MVQTVRAAAAATSGGAASNAPAASNTAQRSPTVFKTVPDGFPAKKRGRPTAASSHTFVVSEETLAHMRSSDSMVQRGIANGEPVNEFKEVATEAIVNRVKHLNTLLAKNREQKKFLEEYSRAIEELLSKLKPSAEKTELIQVRDKKIEECQIYFENLGKRILDDSGLINFWDKQLEKISR
jgi:hypothetical protein